MAVRKRILISFHYDEGWIGGTYYILNLIKALNLLEESDKPLIIVSTTKESEKEIIDGLHYQFLEYRQLFMGFNLVKRLINKLYKTLTGRKIFTGQRLCSDYDNIFINYYALSKTIEAGVPVNKIICWIPDLQDLKYPRFFSSEELEFRQKQYSLALTCNVRLLFSSEASKKDFTDNFSGCTNRMDVVHFAVFHPDYESTGLTPLLGKYSVKRQYFIISNQFWEHKNHQLILKSIYILKHFLAEHPVHFVFTGNVKDNTSRGFFDTLSALVTEYGIQEYVQFLGLIPRDEQLRLMKGALAVIQPSCFEGWSTVVEDAKAMNQFILLSNIDVHREQINENCRFFDTDDAEKLSSYIEELIKAKPEVTYFDYSLSQLGFSGSFKKILE